LNARQAADRAALPLIREWWADAILDGCFPDPGHGESAARTLAEYLFVYGTLRSSTAPPELQNLLAPLPRIGRATTAGVLYDLGKYPGAVFGGAAEIVGEVIELPQDERLLAALDDYEGFDPHDREGSLYLRAQQQVRLVDGRPLDCWAYAYNRDLTGRASIPGGDYLAYRSRQ
jgi:gamma-glutamylcyclotransferase (GGCT)/AIG2-like uncharacterized protein YtfP